MESADIEVLRDALAWRRAGRRVALVTVVATWGSSPRPVGALLALADDGTPSGSVSGGCVEDDLMRRLAASFPQRPEVLRYGVTREEALRYGLPCGGTLELVVEPVEDVASLAAVVAALGRRELIGRRLDLASGEARAIEVTRDDVLAFDGSVLTSVYGPRWRMLLVGAGQLSRYLAEFAKALGYEVLTCDPREEYARSWNVAGARLLPGMPDDVVRELEPDARTVIVTLTHDPKLDDLALLEALKSNAFYVGALGSRATNARRRERLAQFDLAQHEIDRLHGPVGLAIGSRTPPEIAVAILAELTALRGAVPVCAAATETTDSCR
ncbi:MAG TPA: XdhC family protein [Pelomicrobium sp.]|nr:XdhC family protein [Pelomicrobium sp.]